jgi:hypothetical protein
VEGIKVSVVVTVLLFVGVVLLVFGFVKSNRNVLLLAGILLLVGAVLPEFGAGFAAGFSGGAAAAGARK